MTTVVVVVLLHCLVTLALSKIQCHSGGTLDTQVMLSNLLY